MCWTSVIRHRVRPKLLWTEPLLWLTVPKGHHRFSRCWRPVSMALSSSSSLLTVDDAHWTPPQFFKVATGMESSGSEFGVLEDDRCIDTGVFQQRYLVHEFVSACSLPPGAAPPDQPYYPDSGRVVCHSRTGPMGAGSPSQSPRPRRQEPKCTGTDRSLGRSAALHLGLREETTFRSDGPCWSLPMATQTTQEVCVRGGRSSVYLLQSPAAVPLKPDTWLYCVSWCPTCHGKKRCWTADALCRLDSSFAPQHDSEQDHGSPEAVIVSGEEPSEDDKPFLPRFLLHEIIFAHSPCEGVGPNQPRRQRNLLCRADWLCLRKLQKQNARSSPIRELAAYPGCIACEHPSLGERINGTEPATTSQMDDGTPSHTR